MLWDFSVVELRDVAEHCSEVEAVLLQHCAIRREDCIVLFSAFWLASEVCEPNDRPSTVLLNAKGLRHGGGGGGMIAMKPKVFGRLNFVLYWPRSRGNQTYIGGCALS
jgi:hypothetical protein